LEARVNLVIITDLINLDLLINHSKARGRGNGRK